MGRWELSKAQDRLNQVIQEAQIDGPQIITQGGREIAVVLSVEEYRTLTRTDTSLVDFFRSSPLAGRFIEVGRLDEASEVQDL